MYMTIADFKKLIKESSLSIKATNKITIDNKKIYKIVLADNEPIMQGTLSTLRDSAANGLLKPYGIN